MSNSSPSTGETKEFRDTVNPRLEIVKVFAADAAEIDAARYKAKLIHSARDVRSSGDEVERTIRRILSRRLPNAYRTGHGHIVNSKLIASPQFDVIISDHVHGPVLFQAEDGSDYLPFESVYAIGEVKTSYLKTERQIEKFSSHLQFLKKEFVREKSPRGAIVPGIALGEGFSVSHPMPYKNPFFSFMFFVNSGNFCLEDIEPFYAATPIEYLPNLVCFLDKGVIHHAIVSIEDERLKHISASVWPEFNAEKTFSSWVWGSFSNVESGRGSNLALLYFMLLEHLNHTILGFPPMLKYYESGFGANEFSTLRGCLHTPDEVKNTSDQTT